MHTRALLFRFLRIAVAISVVAPLCAAEFADQTSAARKSLTVRQLETRIRQNSPDFTLGEELRTQGLDARVDWPLIERMKKLGAGPNTIAALQHLIPKVRLAIHTVPGASVAMEGAQVATVGETGELVLAIQPGSYNLLVSMKDHTSFTKMVRLALDQPQEIDAPLEWTVGFLTLDAGVKDAKISIAGAGEYAGRVEKLPVPIGPHEVRVTAPYRLAFSTVTVIEGGATRELPISLEIDTEALQAVAAEIRGAYAKADYYNAIKKGSIYLDRGGADKETLKVLALSYYQDKRFEAFPVVAAKALIAGAELTFHVTHYHSAFTLRGDHGAQLGVSTTEVRYLPIGKCNIGSVTIPIQQVHCSLRSSGESSTLILSYPNPKSPGKNIELNLVDTVPAELEVIMRLIELATHPASAPTS